jgi:hypothetical protein
MSISVQRVIEMLEDTGGNLNAHELGFLLTVLRDNSTDDYVHDNLNFMVNKIWNESRAAGGNK